jgi:hypothetical protein
MLANVKKLMAPDGRNELTAKFGAWWDGRDFVPEPPAEEGAEAASAEPSVVVPVKAPAPRDDVLDDALFDEAPKAARPVVDGQTPRLRAIESIWGEGAFGPVPHTLYSAMVEAAHDAGTPGRVGMIGGDGNLFGVIRKTFGSAPVVSEWRSGCLDRMRAISGSSDMTFAPVDRSNAFEPGSLGALISQDCFAYSDHKAGLVTRANRALADGGRWVFTETVKRTKKTPGEAFASAWSEPLLAAEGEIEELMGFAGLKISIREDVTHEVLEAAREAFKRLPVLLEEAAAIGLDGRDGALYLRELSWELQSWRARMRALEGGALGVIKWMVEKSGNANVAKPKTAAKAEPEAVQSAEPMNQSAVDNLFE